MIKIKRIYAPPSRDDVKRIYIDRLWPRGMKKEEVKIDEWLKEISPSDTLRKWFGHDPSKYKEFRRRYAEELYTATLIAARNVIPAKAGIQENTGFRVKPGMTGRKRLLSSCRQQD